MEIYRGYFKFRDFVCVFFVVFLFLGEQFGKVDLEYKLGEVAENLINPDCRIQININNQRNWIFTWVKFLIFYFICCFLNR